MRPIILVVEDDPPVRAALLRDLRPFRDVATVEAAESAEEAFEVIEALAPDTPLALVLADHRLPARSGVDLLVDLSLDPRHQGLKKVLVTGQADHADTIRAVNEANLDHYIAKPWDPDELHTVVRSLLSHWVAEHVSDVLPYLAHLDPEVILRAARRRTPPD